MAHPPMALFAADDHGLPLLEEQAVVSEGDSVLVKISGELAVRATVLKVVGNVCARLQFADGRTTWKELTQMSSRGAPKHLGGSDTFTDCASSASSSRTTLLGSVSVSSLASRGTGGVGGTGSLTVGLSGLSSLNGSLVDNLSDEGLAGLRSGGGGGEGGRVPSLRDVSVESGPAEGGTPVWLQGEGFAAGTVVTFGSQRACAVEVCSSELIKCCAPPCEMMPGATEQRVAIRVAAADDAAGLTLGSVAADSVDLGELGAHSLGLRSDDAAAEGPSFTYIGASSCLDPPSAPADGEARAGRRRVRQISSSSTESSESPPADGLAGKPQRSRGPRKCHKGEVFLTHSTGRVVWSRLQECLKKSARVGLTAPRDDGRTSPLLDEQLTDGALEALWPEPVQLGVERSLSEATVSLAQAAAPADPAAAHTIEVGQFAADAALLTSDAGRLQSNRVDDVHDRELSV